MISCKCSENANGLFDLRGNVIREKTSFFNPTIIERHLRTAAYEPAMLKKLLQCFKTDGAAFSCPNSGTINEHKMTKPRYWSRDVNLSLETAGVLTLPVRAEADVAVTTARGKQRTFGLEVTLSYLELL